MAKMLPRALGTSNLGAFAVAARAVLDQDYTLQAAVERYRSLLDPAVPRKRGLMRGFRVGNWSLAAGVASLGFALVVAGDNIGNGAYETSVYASYPQMFWLLLGAALLLGVFSAYLGLMRVDESRAWIGGFLLVVGVHVLVLLLPLIRGYAFRSHWDELYHFSYTLTTLRWGRLDQANFYPASHLLAAVLARVSGLDLHVVFFLFPLLFYIVFLCNTALLSQIVGGPLRLRAMMMLFSTPMPYYYFGSMFFPTHFAAYMLPLVLSLLLATRSPGASSRHTLSLLLVLFFLPFVHPWAVLASAALMWSLSLVGVTAVDKRRPSRSGMPVRRRGFLVPLGILMVAWLSWFMSFRMFGVAVRVIARSFIEGIAGFESLSRYLEVAQRANLGFDRMTAIFIHTYGANLILLAVAGTIVIWTTYRVVRRTRDAPRLMISLALFSVLFVTLAAASLFRDLLSGNPLRFTNFVVVCIPALLTGLDFGADEPQGATLGRRGWIATREMLLLALLLVASILGISGLHPSPLTGQASFVVSYGQEAGIRFLVERAGVLTGRLYSPMGLRSLPAAVMDSEELSRLRTSQPRWWIEAAPAHFGYRAGVGGITEFTDPAYLIVTAFDMSYYIHVWPDRGQFTIEDFVRLREDPRWNRAYSSGDLSIFQWR